MKNEKHDHMALIAIVAIVAIVGLFLMFFNQAGTTSMTTESTDLSGQAIEGLTDMSDYQYYIATGEIKNEGPKKTTSGSEASIEDEVDKESDIPSGVTYDPNSPPFFYKQSGNTQEPLSTTDLESVEESGVCFMTETEGNKYCYENKCLKVKSCQKGITRIAIGSSDPLTVLDDIFAYICDGVGGGIWWQCNCPGGNLAGTEFC